METPDSARWPLAPERVLGTAILPWLHRALGERSTFSLLEVGTFNGLYSLELAARYPNATVVHLEPNGTLWEPHAALGVNRRLANALRLIGDQVDSAGAEEKYHGRRGAVFS